MSISILYNNINIDIAEITTYVKIGNLADASLVICLINNHSDIK